MNGTSVCQTAVTWGLKPGVWESITRISGNPSSRKVGMLRFSEAVSVVAATLLPKQRARRD